MLTSILGTIVILFILTVPGFFLYSFLFSDHRKHPIEDSIALTIILSLLWNYIFFIPRMYPSVRITAYVVMTAALIGYVLYTQKRLRTYVFNRWVYAGVGILAIGTLIGNLGSVQVERSFLYIALFASFLLFFWCKRKAIMKKHLAVPLLITLVGAVMVGYPLHVQNLSRLHLNPQGGDVEFFLYKTHLLESGYSIFDDMYADQITYYPNLLMSQIALTSYATDGQVGMNAETFRIIMSVLIFLLIYLVGRGIRFEKHYAALFAVISLTMYHIWSHLEHFVAAGMAFVPTLIFLYFLMRAYHQKSSGMLWVLAGFTASMSVHAHPVHGLFAGFFSGVMLLIALLRDRTLHSFKHYVAGTAPLVLLYIVPLIWVYGLKASSTFYLEEEFTTTITDFMMSLVKVPSLCVALGLCGVVLFSKKRFTAYRTAAVFYTALLFSAIVLRIGSILTHRLAIYIDIGDLFTLLIALAWVAIALAVSLIAHHYVRGITKYTKKWLWGAVVVAIILLFPSPLQPSLMARYGTQLWSMTKLPPASGYRSVEGNINEPFFDELSREIERAVPAFSSAILLHNQHIHAFGSHMGRQIVLYELAHSTLFLEPPYLEREKEMLDFFAAPTEAELKRLIKKYNITHVIFSWTDSRDLQRVLSSASFLREVPIRGGFAELYAVAERGL